MEEEWPERCIVFANTKHKCEEIWGYLAADGHRVGLLTGDVAQKKRLSLLKQFTDGELDILVATDVAARGLHISDVITFTVLVVLVEQVKVVCLSALLVKNMR